MRVADRHLITRLIGVGTRQMTSEQVLHPGFSAGLMVSFSRIAALTLVIPAALLPSQASTRSLDCTVRYECSGGSCREVSRSFRTNADAESIIVQSQGYEARLMKRDQTSGGDLIYGGQIGPDLYGILFLEPSNGAQLMLQGLNGWSENKSEMLICTEAAS